jgi:hypothetical protein
VVLSNNVWAGRCRAARRTSHPRAGRPSASSPCAPPDVPPPLEAAPAPKLRTCRGAHAPRRARVSAVPRADAPRAPCGGRTHPFGPAVRPRLPHPRAPYYGHGSCRRHRQAGPRLFKRLRSSPSAPQTAALHCRRR